jgi:hypothetical protein
MKNKLIQYLIVAIASYLVSLVTKITKLEVIFYISLSFSIIFSLLFINQLLKRLIKNKNEN